MYQKLEILRVHERISICLRKKFSNINNVTASQVLDQNDINELVSHDDGYRLLESLPSSPSYWQREGKEIKAMIRQKGVPTFFITLSAAETKWGELLRILKKIRDGVWMSIDECLNLSFLEKADLIRNDPITCARYFDHRIKLLLNVMRSKSGMFKTHPIYDFYWRIEVQKRGSLHLHGLFWMKNAPKFQKEDPSNLPDIIKFIDTYCTTNIDVLKDENLQQYMKHKHTNTCRREIKNGYMCRFKIPKPPMPETKILCPLQDNGNKCETELCHNNYKKFVTY